MEISWLIQSSDLFSFKESEHLLGDINLDSYISIIDILEIINIISGSIQPTNFELIASDLNMDGNINIQDIILIINIIIN